MRAMKRTAVREIRGSLGRYFAIFAIIALGVGFFSGVRITTPAMINTINEFLDEKQFYDYRLLSSAGWSSDDAEFFSEQSDVRYAEGSYSFDVLYDNSGNEEVLKTHSITENVNGIELSEGRMPTSTGECVVDSKMGAVNIGDVLKISSENDENTIGSFAVREFTVVGKAKSSIYINFERGTSSIGNGSVAGFVYIMPEAVTAERFTEISIRFDQDLEIYSDEYKNYMKNKSSTWEELAAKQAAASCAALMGVSSLPESSSPQTYVLDRNTNIGYSCFESDSQIVEQVARVFPIFFILVAVLVCMTTMSRMVEEQRTQIGVFKALGYPESSIMGRFMFYSGSASLLGCISGYGVGVILFPKVIWMTYELMYIKLPMRYVFSPSLAATALGVSLICSLGTTYISCRYELSETAAGLMRPKSPKAGKRVFLERITFIWKRMKFLHKVSVRNIFRYKKRFFMMLLGIGGCTALLLAGFGLKDSVAGFADLQYGEIVTADASLVYRNNTGGRLPESLEQVLDENTEEYVLLHEASWDLLYGDRVKSIYLEAPEDFSAMKDLMTFRTPDGEEIAAPGVGEAIISNSIHERYGADVGDEITLRSSDMHEIKVRVTGVFENHVYNYIFVAPATIEQQTAPVSFNGVYMRFAENADKNAVLTAISRDSNVVSTTLFEDIKTRLGNMMSSLDYIVLLIIICAAGLAFIVLYNLTNINITERLREIATIKVLGFFRRETSAYVLRENLALTALGTLIGLGLGVLLHRYVMQQIVVDLVSFRVRILPMSYVYSVLLTFVFNLAVNFFMEIKLDRINMAGSLKSVE